MHPCMTGSVLQSRDEIRRILSRFLFFFFPMTQFDVVHLSKIDDLITFPRKGCGGYKVIVLATDTSELTLCSWLNVRHIFSFQGNFGVFRLTTDRKCSVLF